MVLVATGLVVVGGESEPAFAADPVPCSVNSPWLVNQRSSGTDVQNKDNVLEYFDVDPTALGLVTPPIVDLDTLAAPNRPSGIDEELNGLGISPDGTKAYVTSHYLNGSPNAPTGGSQIYEVTLADNSVRAWPTPAVGAADDNLRVRRGGVDPRSGVFYYSTSNANGTVQYLYAINPTDATPTPWYVGSVATPNQIGVSGDFAFDGQGQMFLVTGSASVAYVNVLDGVLPTEPQAPVQLTVRNLSTVSGTGNGVGVTYGLNGYLYVTNTAGEWFEVDPSTGAVVADLGNIGGDGATVDLATCAYPSTLTVVKDVESKPYAADQFTLTATRDDGARVGEPVTTTGRGGPRSGQLGPVPVLTGTTTAPVDYTVSETLAAGSPSGSFAAYGTHLRCVDSAAPGSPVLFEGDLTGNASRGATFAATGPADTAGFQAIVCTFTNRDVRPARLILDKTTDPVDDAESFVMHYPNVGGVPDDGVWQGAPRPADSFTSADPIDGDGQGLTFQPYQCTQTSKHVFANCQVSDVGAGPLDIGLTGLGATPAGVLQFQEQLTDDQVTAGWRRAGVPQCTATNTNPDESDVVLDSVDPSDGTVWSQATGGLARYQVAVGSVRPGTVISCNVRNSTDPASWGVSKSSSPLSGTADEPAQVMPGDTVTYTARIENYADTGAALRNVVVHDDLSGVLSAGVTLDPTFTVDIDGAPGPIDDENRSLVAFDPDTQQLTWSADFVDPGSVWELHYSVTIAGDRPVDTYGLHLDNTLWATGATTPPETCSVDEPCRTYHETPAPTWTVSKATSTGALQPDGSYLTTPGFPVVYTITVDNSDGEVPLQGVTVDDGPVGGTMPDIWDVAAWDGTFTVQTVSAVRYTVPVASTPHTDPDPSDGLQYTFDQPIPAGESAVISFTLVLDADQFRTRVQNVVTASMPDAPQYGPADCDAADGPTQAEPCQVIHSTAPGTLTLEKTTDPAGWEHLFGLSADSGLPAPPLADVPVAFSGTAGTGAVSRQPVYSGVRYTISEAPAGGRDPADWTNTAWSCWVETDPESELFTVDVRRLGDDATTTVLVASGQDAVCAIANTLAAGTTLALAKQLADDDGGDASPTAWTLVAQAGADSPVIDAPGVQQSPTRAQTAAADVTPGTAYTLSETGGSAGYEPADPAWVCLDASDPGAPVDLAGDVVTPEPGQDLVCTVTNEDLPGIVTMTKYGPADDEPAVPLPGAEFALWFDQDGSGTFDPAQDTMVAGGTTGDDGMLQWTALGWGTYFVQEVTPPPGYGLAPVQTVVVDGDATSGAGASLVVNDPLAVPGGWTLAKSSDPSSGSVVQPGATIVYTLTATNTSGAAVAAVTATDDLSGLLAHARLVTPLAAGLVLGGDVLTWTVAGPLAPGGVASVSYAVVVRADAWQVELDNVATPGDPAGSCAVCTTEHRTPDEPQPPPGTLPITGLDAAALVALAVLLTAAGAPLVALGARRRRSGP